MVTRNLRHALAGISLVLAGVAEAENLHMVSGHNGTVTFKAIPVGERFAGSSDSGRRHSSGAPRHPGRLAPPDMPYFDRLVAEIARGYELDSALLHAVISVESRYNPWAVSPSGAVGLMQLMPATARRYGVQNALDPEQNLRGGAQYLRDLLGMFDSDVRLALAAYHAGEGTVARYKNTIPPFQTTIDFVAKVLDIYQKHRSGPVH